MTYKKLLELFEKDNETLCKDVCGCNSGEKGECAICELPSCYEKTIKAIKKQIPRRPLNDWVNCPNCGESFCSDLYFDFGFCYICGQALDWSDEE